MTNRTQIQSIVTATILGLVASLTIASLGLAQSTSPSIQQQLQKRLPQIIDYLNERNLKNVGVLKFRIKKPGEKTSSSVGPINSLLADRLEVGLILANPFDKDKQLNIIREASAQAQKIDAANHVTAEGRAALFGPKFDLSWGEEPVTADAFLTGVVQVHEDNQNVTVGVLCFDKSGGKLQRACDLFDARLDASSLTEMGESFTLRGAFDGGSAKLTFEADQQQKQQQVLQQAAQVKTKQISFPLVDASVPVRLEVTYDGQPVSIEMRDSRAFVREPQMGQKVEFAIVRTPVAQGHLGVVLKVNGENTLYRETKRDIDCNKWILSPQHTRTVIKGYQVRGTDETEQFSVLSQSESAKRAMNYGRQVGQIQLTVFKEQTGPKRQPTLIDEDEEDLLAMLRGVQPAEIPKNLGALKHQIRLAGKTNQTRGLIVQGQKKSNKIKTVKFTADPTPVMSATIAYYK